MILYTSIGYMEFFGRSKNMNIETKRVKIISVISLVFLFSLSSGVGSAQQAQENPREGSVSFSLSGGYAHAETRRGMVDLKAEIQISLSPNFRIGFGLGYLSDSDNMHIAGSFAGVSGGMMGGMSGGFSGHRHEFRVIPITLSLYYILPVNPRMDIFMVGGGGYYLGSFEDVSSQDHNAFGPHAGLGIDFKITDRIVIGAEGVYRFVNLKGFESELHPGFREGLPGEDHEEGFWHFHHGQGDYHFHGSEEDEGQMFLDSSPFDISLNGFSLRAGIKFKF